MNWTLVLLVLMGVAVVTIMAIALMWTARTYSESLSKVADTRAGELREVLDAFARQSESNEGRIATVLAPAAGAGPASVEAALATLGLENGPRMTTFSDFDESDPTDQFLQPERTNGVVGLEGDSPFGIPGLKVEFRKDPVLPFGGLSRAG